MSEWIEVTASTVDAAKERALDLLGVAAEDAEFELMTEPGRQMFGLRRVDARIRARVRPTRPRPKQERVRNQRRDRRGGRGEASRRRGEKAASEAAAERGGPARTGAAVAAATQDRSSEGTRGDGRRTARRRNDGQPHDGRPSDGRPGDDQAASDGQRRYTRRASKDVPSRDEEDEVSTEEVSMSAQAEEVGTFLEGLLEAFELEGDVVVGDVEDDTVSVDINGEGLGLLIGPRGQTMSALHELTKTVLQRSAGTGPRVRVRLDIAGYRQRRKEALAQFVRAQAAEVIASGTARALEPMNAADRKVVHDTCNELSGVATVSDGDEPRRRVIIIPAE